MGSLPTITDRLKHDGAFIFPYAFIGLLFFLNVIAIPIPLISGAKVPLFLMAVYYWSMYRPTLMPSWLLFISGVLVDILSGLPIGLNAIIYVTSGWLISRKRRLLMAQPFIVIWTGFCLLCLVMLSLRWALFGVFSAYFPPFIPVLNSSLLGCLFFPLMCVMLRMTHKILPAG